MSKKIAQKEEVLITPKRVVKKVTKKEPSPRIAKKKTIPIVHKVPAVPTRKKKQPSVVVAPSFISSNKDKVVPLAKQSPVVQTVPSIPFLREVSLLALSEKTATRMSLLSRTAGVFIACFGIWCSLYSANSGFNTLTQTALLQEIATTTSMLPLVDCTLSENFTNPECATLVNKKPLPTLNLEGNLDNVTGRVPLTVTVPHAEQVKMQVVRATDGLIVTPFSYLQKTSEMSWEHSLDTTVLDPGIYRIKVVVNNFYGGYDHISPNKFTKQAAVPLFMDAQNTIATTTGGNTPPVPGSVINSTVVSEIKILSVISDKPQSVDSFVFYIKTENASAVALEAINVDTNKIYPIGNAEQVSVGNWRRIWNASSVPVGSYRIRAIAYQNSNSVTASPVTVKKIVGEMATYTTPTIPITTTEPTKEVASSTEIKELKPPVKINVLAPTPLKGVIGISIDVAQARTVTLLVQSKSSLRESPLGSAIPSSPTTWIYTMDTSTFPDGEYALKAVVQNAYGEYEAIKTGLVFKNIPTIVPSVAETAKIEALKSIPTEPVSVQVSAPLTPQASTATAPLVADEVPARSVPVLPPLISPQPEKPDSINAALETQLTSELDKLSVSLRLEDAEAVVQITENIEVLKSSISYETDGEGNEITDYVDKMIARTKENVERTNILITERTKQKASEDFDKDLISDYDEVRLYRTNPFVADTDNDGFLDGVEVQSGYDPLDATPEVLVAFESPKETGVVREDILKVKSITAADTGDIVATGTEPVAVALLSGYALPNSFITIYIYSTPIIVTIKTDSDGSWNYRLDKELEDGEHEVYIGVTDNAGKIVAKSARFAFIKRAEAFDGVVVDTPAAVTTGDESRLFSSSAINIILAVSTMAIGLIFMLFGVQLVGRKEGVEPKPQL